jgi:hypothetical protein
MPYRIDTSRGRWRQRPLLCVGSRVRPGSLIGYALKTGEPVRATGHGEVVGLSFLAGQFVVDVFIQPDGRNRIGA